MPAGMRKFTLILFVAACEPAAVSSAPDLAPARPPAETDFWSAFETQSYADLPSVRSGLQAAYDANPKDPETTLLLGHANLWTLAEFGRDPRDPSALPSRATDALRYFTEAAQLAPDDQRVPGWLGSIEVAIGNITGNADLLAQGQARIDAGAAAYPEFNLFVRALINGQLPIDSPDFPAGLEAMWQTLDLCAGESVDRAHPDFTKYLSRRTMTGPQRVCWNDHKARHNFEGFFLYMGDLALKSGDPATATQLYGNAKLSDSYATWPFSADLEQRIAEAVDRAKLYRDGDPMNDPPLANQTSTSCASCHAVK